MNDGSQRDRGPLVLRDDRWRIRHGSGLRCLVRAPNLITHSWGQWGGIVLRGVTWYSLKIRRTIWLAGGRKPTGMSRGDKDYLSC